MTRNEMSRRSQSGNRRKFGELLFARQPECDEQTWNGHEQEEEAHGAVAVRCQYDTADSCDERNYSKDNPEWFGYGCTPTASS